MVRKGQLTKEDRQTIITPKSVGLSFREMAKKSKVSGRTVSYIIKRYLETGVKIGGGLTDPKQKQIQKTGFWESTACMTGSSQDNLKHSLTLAEESKSQFRL